MAAVVFQLRPDGHQRPGEVLWRSLLRVPPPVSAQSHRLRGRLGRDHRRHRVLGGPELLGGVLGQCVRANSTLMQPLPHSKLLKDKAAVAVCFPGRARLGENRHQRL